MKKMKDSIQVDFRNYLVLEDYLVERDSDDVFFDGEDIQDGLDYYESPFKPIEMKQYVMNIHASEQNFCTPAINSLNKYVYNEWEVIIEKFHEQYGYVVCTAEIMNELGYSEFEPMDHYIAYAPTELVQEIFDNLVNKIVLPFN